MPPPDENPHDADQLTIVTVEGMVDTLLSHAVVEGPVWAIVRWTLPAPDEEGLSDGEALEGAHVFPLPPGVPPALVAAVAIQSCGPWSLGFGFACRAQLVPNVDEDLTQEEVDALEVTEDQTIGAVIAYARFREGQMASKSVVTSIPAAYDGPLSVGDELPASAETLHGPLDTYVIELLKIAEDNQ